MFPIPCTFRYGSQVTLSVGVDLVPSSNCSEEKEKEKEKEGKGTSQEYKLFHSTKEYNIYFPT